MDKPRKLSLFVLFGLTLSCTLLVPTVLQGQESLIPPANSVNILQAFILGLVQGMTEFIPISSTAHLKVIPVLLGWGDPGIAFSATIQLGSIGAVFWYFWEDLRQLTLGTIEAIQKQDYQSNTVRMVGGIFLGTVPIAAIGLGIKVFVPNFDESPIRKMTSIAIASIVMAILLGIAEKWGSRQRDYDRLGMQDGILMGCAQALAIIPGVSRSGSTITAGLFMGLERATAARFSFLLGIPAITLAGLVELVGLLDSETSGVGLPSLIVGLVSSAFFSYIAIAWLIKFLQTRSTWLFIWYRLIFGIVILIGIATQFIPNS
ncbi:undecaprenyl-diphosphate phosphatase [Roseofilum casamattae]|uniref:Undecaprenyl-diphosphatase n=1 Tax=Roseofilum casamattae BLCC-M143 TaxID=3022442 RepID=A0ABT7BYW0_9CYAN|nr:undecaprenyl-diphosphate phosphatase [Roseofilum casamattae]MDJ1183679.1 undecaprenyl-diphosphate phosphatase [Roseofilum casamattae BLCC-M143]